MTAPRSSRPKEVRVGVLRYDIEYPDRIWDEQEERERWAEHDTLYQAIRIANYASPEHATDSLVHEILHAVASVTDTANKLNEDTITRISGVLTQALLSTGLMQPIRYTDAEHKHREAVLLKIRKPLARVSWD